MKIPTTRIFARRVRGTGERLRRRRPRNRRRTSVSSASVARRLWRTTSTTASPSAPPCSGTEPSSARPGRGRRLPASSRCPATCSPRRTSTPTVRCGAIRDISAATVQSPSRTCGPAAAIGKDPPASAPWGHCDRDYPRKSIVSPYPFRTAQAHYEALLAETRRRGGPTVQTPATLPNEWNGIYRQPRFSPRNDNWITMRHVQVPTVLSLLTDRVQAAHGAGNLPSRAHEQADVAVAVLLARRLHAALARMGRIRPPGHGHSADGPDLHERRDELRHQHPCGPRVQDGRTRAAPGRAGAALVRRDHRLLGSRHADHLDLEHPAVDLAHGLRTLGEDAVHRDLHVAARCAGPVHRPESRGDPLRPGGAGGSHPYHPAHGQAGRLRRRRGQSHRVHRMHPDHLSGEGHCDAH